MRKSIIAVVTLVQILALLTTTLSIGVQAKMPIKWVQHVNPTGGIDVAYEADVFRDHVVAIKQPQTPTMSTTTKLLFIVGLGNSSDWRDYVALAIYPIVVKYRHYILFGNAQSSYDPIKLTEAQKLFISKAKPTRFILVGATSNPSISEWEVEILSESNSEVVLAGKLAKMFWERPQRAVLVEQGNYTAAILGSYIASRLQVPLLYLSFSYINETKSLLRDLGVSECILLVSNQTLAEMVGKIVRVLNISNKPLDEIYHVLGYNDTSYFVVANIKDKDSEPLKRLSILSPLLASFREGLMLPLSLPPASFSEFKVREITLSPPSSNPDTDDLIMNIKDWSITYERPKAELRSRVFYPVNGSYAKGLIWFYGEYIPVYVGASSEGARRYDAILLDLDGDGRFTDDELFTLGDVIKVPVGYSCISDRLGDDDPGYRYFELLNISQRWREYKGLYLYLKSRSWITGEVSISNERFKALIIESFLEMGIASSTDPRFGVIPILYIDLNHDGIFSEEERFRMGEVNILGFPAFLAQYSWVKPAILWPSGSYVKKVVRGFLDSMHSANPKYLVLIGGPTMIPPANIPYDRGCLKRRHGMAFFWVSLRTVITVI